MSILRAPFRCDVVGSYLRPEYLKEARVSFSKGEISKEDLTTIEDNAILDLIEKQKNAGLSVLTDGEFRRSSWHLDFMWAFKGIGHQKTDNGIPFADEDALIDDTFCTGKISVENHPFVEHFKFIKAQEDEKTVARQTIPAPSQFLFQLIMPQNYTSTMDIYCSEENLISDIILAYEKVISDLYESGCRNLQLDDCTWGVCVDPNACLIWNTDEDGLQKQIKKLITINNMVIKNSPDDLVITTHVCRGNFHSTWACQGGYEAVAEALFGNEEVDAFYLEFDDARSGGFEPLRFVNKNKQVVLGLVTSKSPIMEKKEDIIARIHEASKYVPLERLCLSPQCGFASTEEGNKLTEDDQWNKIKLIKEISQEVWG